MGRLRTLGAGLVEGLREGMRPAAVARTLLWFLGLLVLAALLGVEVNGALVVLIWAAGVTSRAIQ